VNFGDKNVLAVRVDATLGEGWFYEGAGIYRHVWLTKTDPLHVAEWGTFVRSEGRPQSALISVSSEVENESEKDQVCRVTWSIVDPEGKTVAAAQAKPAKLEAWGTNRFEAQTALAQPRLWSLEQPHLYRLITTVASAGAVTDRQETTFGVRTIR